MQKEKPTIISQEVLQQAADNTVRTTNQVKANLISANMFKGDIILTKPGQAKLTQKVTYMPKQMVMKASGELKDVGIKKQYVISKGQLSQIGGGDRATSTVFTTRDGKLVTIPIGSKAIVQGALTSQPKVVGQLSSQALRAAAAGGQQHETIKIYTTKDGKVLSVAAKTDFTPTGQQKIVMLQTPVVQSQCKYIKLNAANCLIKRRKISDNN